MNIYRATDIHSHVVPASFPRYVGAAVPSHWPSMTAGCGCGPRTMAVDGHVFRTFEAEAWDVARRIEVMYAAGLDRQVLSPLPELLSYWLDPADGELLCRYVNDTIGEMVSAAPGHFLGMGCVPLQDLDRALAELERLMGSSLFCGVEMGTNVAGISIGDPRFEPVFARAEALEAAIFIHPERPVGRDRLAGPAVLGNLAAHPCELALAVTSLITGGMLDRHPRLRLAVAHGGGAFPIALPRLEYGWRTVPGLAERIGASPTAQARRLFWDNLVYDAGVIDFLIARFGAGQLCLGTDMPAAIQEGVPFACIAHLDPATRQAIGNANAERFLRPVQGHPAQAGIARSGVDASR